MKVARLLGLVALVACQRDPAPAPAASPPPVHAVVLDRPAAHPVAGAPLIVALHGLGGIPERFALVFMDADLPNDIAVIQAFEPFEEDGVHGFAWFAWTPGMTDDQLGDAVAGAEAKLWPVIVERAHGRGVIVVGFSQGAVMAYALAAKHPEILEAIPIAGRLPAKLAPARPGAPVHAIHGTADQVVEIDYGRAAVAEMKQGGGSAVLEEIAGAGHDMHALRPALLTELGRLRAAR